MTILLPALQAIPAGQRAAIILAPFGGAVGRNCLTPPIVDRRCDRRIRRTAIQRASIPATRHVDPDYRKRMAIEDMVARLKS